MANYDYNEVSKLIAVGAMYKRNALMLMTAAEEFHKKTKEIVEILEKEKTGEFDEEQSKAIRKKFYEDIDRIYADIDASHAVAVKKLIDEIK